jgi:hypothetical protein
VGVAESFAPISRGLAERKVLLMKQEAAATGRLALHDADWSIQLRSAGTTGGAARERGLCQCIVNVSFIGADLRLSIRQL